MKKQKVSTTSQCYTAFTLAEILITLMIIGILAMITIPSLYENVQKSALKSSFQRAYNILYNTSYMLLSEDSYDSWGGTGLNHAEPVIMKKYASKIKGATYQANSPFIGFAVETNSFLVTPDLVFQNASYIKDCSFQGNNHGVNNMCLFFFVDTNGEKGPNKGGYDRFTFLLSRRPNNNIEFVPTGIDSSLPSQCTDASCGTTWGCRCNVALRALREPDYFQKLDL